MRIYFVGSLSEMGGLYYFRQLGFNGTLVFVSFRRGEGRKMIKRLRSRAFYYARRYIFHNVCGQHSVNSRSTPCKEPVRSLISW